MHSLKNTFIAVLLLGASYGVYQAITTPDTSVQADREFMESAQTNEPGILSSPGTLAEEAASSLADLPPRRNRPKALPPRLPDQINSSDFFAPEAPKITDGPATSFDENIEQTGASTSDTSRDNRTGDFAVGTADRPDDHLLIDALKQQLEPTTQPPQDSASAQASSLASMDSNRQTDPTPDFQIEQLLQAWPAISQLVDNGEYRQALARLTRFYRSESIVGPQRQKLMGWLNALAGKVVYSAEHNLFARPYIVRPGQQLTDVANEWGVTADLVFKINQQQIPNPGQLQPGTSLKIVKGPFHALIDLSDQTLTLFVDNLYAGQFPVYFNPSTTATTGKFPVIEKTSKIGLGGTPSEQILLKNQVVLAAVGEHPPIGVFGLSSHDARDLFSILTKASTVTITE